MAEVGYLIGAGASAECVPVVNKMGSEIEEIKSKLIRSLKLYIDDGYGGTTPDTKTSIDVDSEKSISISALYESIMEIVGKITEYSQSHSSIDTYAKKLFVSRRLKEYKRLKNDMAFFFTLIQILNKPDKRYDNFWASVLDDSGHPPDKVNI